MADRIKDKVAVVTGAGSGIGLAAARRFHAEGALLVLAGRSAAVEVAADELGARAVSIQGDVSNTADVQRIIDLAVSEYGGLDVLCNVAGADPRSKLSFQDETDNDFDLMVDVNLRGVFNTMRIAVPLLLARGGGSIVNVASSAALIAAPYLSTYGASKAGVLGLTRTVAVEYASQGIRANTVCPGPIQTPMLERGRANNPVSADYIKEKIPMGRVGTAEEVANAMLFLASDESSYVTGIALPVEGGQTAK